MKSWKKLADGLLRSRIALAGLFLCAASCLMSGAEMKAEDVVAGIWILSAKPKPVRL